MELLGHTEFGRAYVPLVFDGIRFSNFSDINHWLKHWLLEYRGLLNKVQGLKNANLACYETLCEFVKLEDRVLEVIRIRGPIELKFSAAVWLLPDLSDEGLLANRRSISALLRERAIQ
mgnify:CR=1 FL=1